MNMHKATFFIVLYLNLITFCIGNAIAPDEAINYLCESLPSKNGQIQKSFFTPDKEHSVKKIMIDLIRCETEEIIAALYRLTEPDIAAELLTAFKRGVKICLITDLGCFFDKNEKITSLYQAGIEMGYYGKPYSIMHNKYWLFKKNFLGPLLVTGSANTTKGGLLSNKENIIVTNNSEMIADFKKNFGKIKGEASTGIPTKEALREYATQEMWNGLKYGIRRTIYSLRVR
ncbi:MAG TPA: phospholipase D-like domain-containing protein [Candidatus Babeliales bacterium]|nr:phospholipase D-like domain-containing protein [Candidatus Babeliales bacterium]